VRELVFAKREAEPTFHVFGIDATVRQDEVDDLRHTADECLTMQAEAVVVEDPLAVAEVWSERGDLSFVIF